MHTPRKLKSDIAAEVGIGTMIVFIATILVAAIAAGVLISTSQKLQAKSTQTGNEATANVIGTLEVVSVQGVRSGTATTNLIDEVNIVVRLASGADPVDLNELVIEFSDGTNQITVTTCDNMAPVAATTEFNTVIQRGTTSACGVMVTGDLVKIVLGDADAMAAVEVDGDDGLDQNERITLNIIPNRGSPTLYRFTVPNLGTSTIVDL